MRESLHGRLTLRNMLEVLAMLVLLAAIAMGIIAFRGWRATLNLAREMLTIRQRLTSLEDGHRVIKRREAEQEERARGIEASVTAASVNVLRERIDVLDGRMAEHARRMSGGLSMPLDVEAPLPQEASPLERAIRRHLRAKGHERVVVLDLDEELSTAWIEAERGGVTVKGTATRSDDGRIRLTTESTVRAFP